MYRIYPCRILTWLDVLVLPKNPFPLNNSKNMNRKPIRATVTEGKQVFDASDSVVSSKLSSLTNIEQFCWNRTFCLSLCQVLTIPKLTRNICYQIKNIVLAPFFNVVSYPQKCVFFLICLRLQGLFDEIFSNIFTRNIQVTVYWRELPFIHLMMFWIMD